MPYILTAVNCPTNPVPTGLYDVSTGPLTSKSYAQGDTTSVRGSLNENAARSDMVGRYGGGVYAVASGLAISAGSGLTLNIAAGHAVIDGLVPVAATTATLTDGGRNFLWLSRAGAITVAFASLVPPAGAQCFLGSALTSGGAISSVDQSGVLYLTAGVPWRRTADTSTPGDAPSSSIQFVHHGVNATYWWDGVSYSTFAPSLPLAIANGGTGAATAAIARDNLGTAGQGQLIKTPAASFNFTASEVNGVSDIEIRTGGGVAASFTATFPSTSHSGGDPTSGIIPGTCWAITNTTGQPCQLTINGGSITQYLASGQRGVYMYDGTELRSVGRELIRWGLPSVTGPTKTYSSFEEVENDYLEFSVAAADCAVTWPAGGALANRGRLQVIKDGSTTLQLSINGTKLLPGECQPFVIDNTGGPIRQVTRPYTDRVGISMGSDANKTVAAPDWLGVFLEITSGVSLTATRDLILPVCDGKLWYISNQTTGGQSIRVIGASGAGVTIRNKKGAWVRQNGTDFVRADNLAITTAGSEEVAATTTSTATVSNTTTETTVLGTQIGSTTLPANLLQPGRSVRFKAHGVFGSDAAAHTLNLKLKFGTTVLVATGAQTPPNGLANRYWEVEALITCRTTGAGGTVFTQGRFSFMAAATGAPTWWEMASTSAVTIDTTAAQTLDLTATYGAGVTASDTITGTNMMLEIAN